MLAFRDSGDLADQQAHAQEDAMRALALNPEIPLSQRKIRPLTRDAIFVQQIRDLQASTLLSKPALRRAVTILSPPPLPTQASSTDILPPIPTATAAPTMSKRYETRSKSFADARDWIQQSTLWRVQQGRRFDGGTESYRFGRPDGSDDDVFTNAFEDVSRFGLNVQQKFASAGADAGIFELDRTLGQSSGAPSGTSKPAVGLPPIQPAAQAQARHPVHKHNTAFQTCFTRDQASLLATLRQRTEDRLAACRSLDRIQGVHALVELDRTRHVAANAGAVWNGKVPYMWYPHAQEIVEASLKHKAKHLSSVGEIPSTEAMSLLPHRPRNTLGPLEQPTVLNPVLVANAAYEQWKLES
ncbi:hypothetical protein HKX48_000766 [Thoreauomyces humboldtii]|nr:hypothetical protein HKX48_000766 [Thoreauomyces humboldtii]